MISRAAQSKPNWGRKILRWSGRAFLVLVGLAMVLLLVGCIYEEAAEKREAKKFPQQGRRVPAGDVALNLDCTGTGGPTVILESGGGVPAIGWYLVQPEVAKFTRVCSYDRAGYGWSAASSAPRTSAQIVKELHALLQAAGEKPPYILVGHSFGGYNVRVYNGTYPQEVAGMVLVDSSHEDQDLREPPALMKLETQIKKQLQTMERFGPFLIRTGILRLTMGHSPKDSSRASQYAEESQYLSLQPKFLQALAEELRLMPGESAAEVRASGNLGNKPLLVLTAGLVPRPKDTPQLRGLTDKDMDDFHEIWANQLQVGLAKLSTKGRQVLVADSTHMIPMERPDAVVSAIREVWAELTTKH